MPGPPIRRRKLLQTLSRGPVPPGFAAPPPLATWKKMEAT